MISPLSSEVKTQKINMVKDPADSVRFFKTDKYQRSPLQPALDSTDEEKKSETAVAVS